MELQRADLTIGKQLSHGSEIRLVSNIADAVRLKYEVDNYIPFNDTDRFGIMVGGEEIVKWKRGTFFKALLRLGILCQKNSVYIPCVQEKIIRGKPVSEDELEKFDKYFRMLGNGKWGFNNDNYQDFIATHFDKIASEIEAIEREESEANEYKKFQKEMRREFKRIHKRAPNEIELNTFIMKQAMAGGSLFK